MGHQERTRLCEWADLVGADLPEEIACESELGSNRGEDRLAHDQ